MKRFNNEILSPHVRLHLDRLQLLLAAGSLAGSDPAPTAQGQCTAGHDEARLPPFRTTLRTQQRRALSRPAMRVHPQWRPDPAQAQHALWQPATATEPPLNRQPTKRDGTTVRGRYK